MRRPLLFQAGTSNCPYGDMVRHAGSYTCHASTSYTFSRLFILSWLTSLFMIMGIFSHEFSSLYG